MASGPGEEIDAARYDWDWNNPSAAAASWVPAASPIRESIYTSTSTRPTPPTPKATIPGALFPTQLPHMEFEPTSPGGVVRTDLGGKLRRFPSSASHRPRRQSTSTFCSTARPSPQPIRG